MSASLEQYGRAVKLVYGDPKFKAQIEWLKEYGVGAQLATQVPRGEMELYAATGQHANPARRISLTVYEMPDFDWWEPRYDHPERRQQARRREAGL